MTNYYKKYLKYKKKYLRLQGGMNFGGPPPPFYQLKTAWGWMHPETLNRVRLMQEYDPLAVPSDEMVILSFMSELNAEAKTYDHYLVEIEMSMSRKRNRLLFCRDMLHDIYAHRLNVTNWSQMKIGLETQIKELYPNAKEFKGGVTQNDAEMVSTLVIETYQKNTCTALKVNTHYKDDLGNFRDQLTAPFIAYAQDGVPGSNIFNPEAGNLGGPNTTFAHIDHGAAASAFASILHGANPRECGKDSHRSTPYDTCSAQRVVWEHVHRLADQGGDMTLANVLPLPLPSTGEWDTNNNEPKCTFKYKGGTELFKQRFDLGLETVYVSIYFGNTKYTYIVQSFLPDAGGKIDSRTLLLIDNVPKGFIIGGGIMSKLYSDVIYNNNGRAGYVELKLWTPWEAVKETIVEVHIGVVQGRKSLGDLIANCILSVLFKCVMVTHDGLCAIQAAEMYTKKLKKLDSDDKLKSEYEPHKGVIIYHTPSLDNSKAEKSWAGKVGPVPNIDSNNWRWWIEIKPLGDTTTPLEKKMNQIKAWMQHSLVKLQKIDSLSFVPSSNVDYYSNPIEKINSYFEQELRSWRLIHYEDFVEELKSTIKNKFPDSRSANISLKEFVDAKIVPMLGGIDAFKRTYNNILVNTVARPEGRRRLTVPPGPKKQIFIKNFKKNFEDECDTVTPQLRLIRKQKVHSDFKIVAGNEFDELKKLLNLDNGVHQLKWGVENAETKVFDLMNTFITNMPSIINYEHVEHVEGLKTNLEKFKNNEPDDWYLPQVQGGGGGRPPHGDVKGAEARKERKARKEADKERDSARKKAEKKKDSVQYNFYKEEEEGEGAEELLEAIDTTFNDLAPGWKNDLVIRQSLPPESELIKLNELIVGGHTRCGNWFYDSVVWGVIAGRCTPAEQVAALNTMSPAQQVAVLTTMSPAQQVAVLSTLTPVYAVAALNTMSPADVVAVLSTMTQDDVVAALTTMTQDQKYAILPVMSPTQQVAVLSTMTPAQQVAILPAMSPPQQVTVLSTMTPVDAVAAFWNKIQTYAILPDMTPVDAVAILSTMTQDDVVAALTTMTQVAADAILSTFPAEKQAEILSTFPAEKRAEILSRLPAEKQAEILSRLRGENTPWAHLHQPS